MCGGGTIPLLQQWLWDGMSMGSAAAFMITGPATKITNLGAMKIVLGWKRFLLYILYLQVQVQSQLQFLQMCLPNSQNVVNCSFEVFHIVNTSALYTFQPLNLK